MSIYEFFVEKEVGNDVLSESVGNTLHVSSKEIVVVADIELSDGNSRVTVVKNLVCGEFAAYVSVYVKPKISVLSEVEFALQLAEHLQCRILVCDDSLNPYSWKQLSPEGAVSTVLLRDEPLDDRGEAFVCKSDQVK